MTVEDKLYQTRFNVDTIPHITVDFGLCDPCETKPCLYVCPAQNYQLDDDKMSFSWQGCLECGACRVACLRGAIEWNYPRGGFGVSLRYG